MPPTVNVAAAMRLLHQMYQQVPAMDCVGRCHHACTTGINMSEAERATIAHTTGVHIPADKTSGSCPALGPAKTCTVYEVRPLICRLWGTTAPLQCPYGCRPKPGYLSVELMIEMMLTSMEIGGGIPRTDIADTRTVLAADPRVVPLVAAMISGNPLAAQALVSVAVELHEQGVLGTNRPVQTRPTDQNR